MKKRLSKIFWGLFNLPLGIAILSIGAVMFFCKIFKDVYTHAVYGKWDFDRVMDIFLCVFFILTIILLIVESMRKKNKAENNES